MKAAGRREGRNPNNKNNQNFTAIHPSDSMAHQSPQAWVCVGPWRSFAAVICISVSPEEEHAPVTPVFMPVFVCGWGRKWRAGPLPYSQTAHSVSHIFLCGHGSVFKPVCCPPTDTSASHQCGDHKDSSVWSTVGLWRRVFAAGEEMGVELTFNDLIVQSGGTGGVFWATYRM